MPDPVVNVVTPEVTVVVASGGLTSGGPTNDPPPTATTVDISGNPDLGDTVATLRGIVQDYGFDCDAWFEWAGPFTTQQTSPALPNSTPSQALPGLPVNLDFAYTISNLTAHRYYYFRARAQNLNGATAGVIMEFLTYPAGGSIDDPIGTDPIPVQTEPTCSTGSAVSISPTSEAISGFADSGAISKLTDLRLFYRLAGTTSWVAATAVPSSTTNNITAGGQTFSATVVVSPNTTYEYYAEAEHHDHSDGIIAGAVLSFTSTSFTGVAPTVTLFGGTGNPQATPSSISVTGNLTDTNANPGDYSTTAIRYRIGTGSYTYIVYDGSHNGTTLIPASDPDPTVFTITALGLQPNTTYELWVGGTNKYGPNDPANQNHVWAGPVSLATLPDTAAVPNASTLTITQQAGAGPALGFTITGTFNAGGNGGETTNCYAKWKFNSSSTIYTSAILDTTTSPIDQPETFNSQLLFADGDSIRAWFYAIQGVDGSGADDAEGARLPLTFNAFPGGHAPTTTSLAASNVTDTTAKVTFTCSDSSLSTSNIHGTVKIEWKLRNASNYPPLNVQTLSYDGTFPLPFAGHAFDFNISGLVKQNHYSVRATIFNERGQAQIENPDLILTTAGSTTNILLNTRVLDWVGCDQATLLGTYQLVAPAVSATLTWQYKTLQEANWHDVYAGGAIFSQAVAGTVGTVYQVDAVVAGLAPNTPYMFQLTGTPNVGTAQVSPVNTQTNFLTGGAPTNIGTSTPTFNGGTPGATGPGTRGTALSGDANGAHCNTTAPSPQFISTYADPRRPSSGLISDTNERVFISNLYAHPTAYATQLASAPWRVGLYPTLASHKGYDIVVYGNGHGIAGRSNWDIEIWNPVICGLLPGGATIPKYITAAQHAQGGHAPGYAVQYFSRWGDVIGVIGDFMQPTLSGSGTQQDPYVVNATGGWQLGGKAGSGTGAGFPYAGAWKSSQMASDNANLPRCRLIVGISEVGLFPLADPKAALDNPIEPTVSSLGTGTNVYCSRINILSNQARAGTWNGVRTGGTCNNPQRNAIWGLLGMQDCQTVQTITQVEPNFRLTRMYGMCRLDFRRVNNATGKERCFYNDTLNPLIAGSEPDSNGVPQAQPSWFIDCTEHATAQHVAGSKGGYQAVYRWGNHLNDPGQSTGGCPCLCTSGDCNSDNGPIPEGTGPMYLIRCVFNTVGSNGAFQLYQHHGDIIVDDCTGNAGIVTANDTGGPCGHRTNPYLGPDGFRYGAKKLWVKKYTRTVYPSPTPNNDNKYMVTVGGCYETIIDDLVIPAALLADQTAYVIGFGPSEDTFGNSAWDGGQKGDANICGKATINFPGATLATWVGWAGCLASKISWCPKTDPQTDQWYSTTSDPQRKEIKYSDAQVNQFRTTVTRTNFDAP